MASAQKAKSRQELEEEKPGNNKQDDFISYLLNGPVYSEKEIEVIEENRNSIAAVQSSDSVFVKLDKELEKFHGKVLFPEKLEEANKTLTQVGIPKIP